MTDDDLSPLPDGITAQLIDPAVWEMPPPELEGRVLAALRTARDEDPAFDDRGRDDLARHRQLRASRRLSPRVLLAAASVVVLALLVTGGLLLRDAGPSPVVVALDSTPLGDGAHGQAKVTDKPSGFQIEVDIDGLRPAPRGSYYQGWLKGTDGLVAIGTFHARHGAHDIDLWSGVDVAEYPTLTITLQQEDAGTDSSGRVLLSGVIR